MADYFRDHTESADDLIKHLGSYSVVELIVNLIGAGMAADTPLLPTELILEQDIIYRIVEKLDASNDPEVTLDPPGRKSSLSIRAVPAAIIVCCCCLLAVLSLSMCPLSSLLLWCDVMVSCVPSTRSTRTLHRSLSS